nr:unnamed protein product [Callosobruchus chinensis]
MQESAMHAWPDRSLKLLRNMSRCHSTCRTEKNRLLDRCLSS